MGRKRVHTKLFSAQVRTKPKGNSLNQQLWLIVCPRLCARHEEGAARRRPAVGVGNAGAGSVTFLTPGSVTFLTPHDRARFPFPCIWVALE